MSTIDFLRVWVYSFLLIRDRVRGNHTVQSQTTQSQNSATTPLRMEKEPQMKTNRMLVSATALFAAIILIVTAVLVPTDVNAGNKKPKKTKKEPIYQTVQVPPDTVVFDQWGNELYTIRGGTVARIVQGPYTSSPAASNLQPSSSASYNHETKSSEGGVGLSIDANRVWDNSGKPAGTSVGVGFAIGRYSAKVETNGSSSYSQDPNNPAYGWGVPTYGYGNGYNGYYGNTGYPVPAVQCVFRLQEGTQAVSVELFDPNGQRMDIIRLGLQGGAFYPSKVMYLPPGRYSLRREGCGPIEWVVPVGQRQVVRDIG